MNSYSVLTIFLWTQTQGLEAQSWVRQSYWIYFAFGSKDFINWIENNYLFLSSITAGMICYVSINTCSFTI